MNTCMEMFVPLIYCITDHALLQATHQTASAAAASVRQQHELHLVELLLHFSSNSVVNQVQIWIDGNHRSGDSLTCSVCKGAVYS